MTEATEKIINTGVLGALLVISFIAIAYLFNLLQKEKTAASERLEKEQNARINDGKETQKLLMEVQKSIIDSVNKLAEVIEWAEKRTEELRTEMMQTRGGRRP